MQLDFPEDVRVLLIDGHALVHRAFHAVADLSTSSGEPTNAVFGFTTMLFKAIETQRPTHIMMAMDRPTKTFRHEEFAGYKAQRPPTPRPLIAQFERIREMAGAFNIPIYEEDGFEADDVLGSLARQAHERHVRTIILTGDTDALQLVDTYVTVLTPRQGMADTKEYDREAVHARYGLEPEQIPDYKALVGDTSDNIPGVRGVGDKTASKLLKDYGTITGIYEHLSELPEKLRIAFEPVYDQAIQSKHLATIVCHVPVALDLDAGLHRAVDRSRVLQLFNELEFFSLIKRVQTSDLLMPDDSNRSVASAQQLSMFASDAAQPVRSDVRTRGSYSDLASGRPTRTPETQTHIVTDMGQLRALVQALDDSAHFAVDTETTGIDPLRSQLVGLSFAVVAGQGWYVPVGHDVGEQLSPEVVLQTLRPVLEDVRPRKVGHNLKYDWTMLHEYGVRLNGLLFDTMIAAYLVNPTSRGLSLSAQALSRLQMETTPIESLIGKGKQQLTMAQVDIDRAAQYAADDADVTLQLMHFLEKDLRDRELYDLFADVEMPLVSVLGAMEYAGIALDPQPLQEMSGDMTSMLSELESRIYKEAGRPFNINSTQQLGHVLFVQLELPSGRKTKSGFSTGIEVLEGLRGKHAIVDDVLEYRQLTKLKNTYIDALPELVNPKTHRVHTDYNQASTATGRLSSSNPNLQNIPNRGEIGRKIRRAFVSGGPNHVLLAADYSQIELRILASMSGDERLVHAFTSGEDVHRATASAVFGVPLSDVTPDQRRIAKVVNFGIIYGIGEARLAYETGITRVEAASFIAAYNTTYAGVKAFMDAMRATATENGYVSTLLGRRRYIPEIHSNNPGIRQAAERAAINMPVQGTAADIIKLAMIHLDRELAHHHTGTQMVLQVHDELVFDVPRDDLEPVAALVQRAMEGALGLSVPIEVDMKYGRDWYVMETLDISG